MSIDIERLKTDAAYWDECGAPEWATMFGLVGVRKLPVWFNLQEYQHASGGHSNRAFDFFNDGTYSLYQISGEIPRPTKPAAPEWDGEGLPPVGCECERFSIKDGQWHGPAKVFHITKLGVCFVEYDHGGWDKSTNPTDFRPLRTKEQRQRDELVDFVATASGIRARDGRGAIALDIADAILARYSLEPKDA